MTTDQYSTGQLHPLARYVVMSGSMGAPGTHKTAFLHQFVDVVNSAIQSSAPVARIAAGWTDLLREYENRIDRNMGPPDACCYGRKWLEQFIGDYDEHTDDVLRHACFMLKELQGLDHDDLIGCLIRGELLQA